jgi:D-sedoheptulose 7-phosphate isomerase
MTFVSDFLDETVQIIRKLDHADIHAVAKVISTTRDQGGRLFLAGSGGGAGHASHATCDFRKLCGIESYCVTDNVSELTARINDEGWSSSLAAWLSASRITSADCLLVFSVGGGSIEPPVSVNLVEAIDFAKSQGASIVGIVGRDGGHLRRSATASVVIPPENTRLVTPQVEGLQAVIWHLLVSHPLLMRNGTKWEGLSK